MLTVENSRISRCRLACLRQRHENTHSDDLTQSAPGAHCLRAPSSAATFLNNTFFCLVQSPRPPRERQAALDGPLPIPLAQRPSDISAGDSHMRRTQHGGRLWSQLLRREGDSPWRASPSRRHGASHPPLINKPIGCITAQWESPSFNRSKMHVHFAQP